MARSFLARGVRARAAAVAPRFNLFANQQQAASFLRPVQQQARTFFQQSKPVRAAFDPLVLRKDGLLVQVFIAAVIFFAAQDVPFILGYLKYRTACAGMVNNAQWHEDTEAAYEEWRSARGLDNTTLKNAGGSYAYVQYSSERRKADL